MKDRERLTIESWRAQQAERDRRDRELSEHHTKDKPKRRAEAKRARTSRKRNRG